MRTLRIALVTTGLALLGACFGGGGGSGKSAPTANAETPPGAVTPPPPDQTPVEEAKNPPPVSSPTPLPTPIPSPTPSPFPVPSEQAFDNFVGEYEVNSRVCDADSLEVPGASATGITSLKIYRFAGGMFLQKNYTIGLVTETLNDGARAADGSLVAITGTTLSATRTATLDLSGLHRVQTETIAISVDGRNYDFAETIDETAWYGTRHSGCRYSLDRMQ